MIISNNLPRIQLLSPLLANQIAAGEVIERPASVMKELVENSLDAGATQIEVLLEAGGIQRLCVRDNGCGIHPEDLTLALSRHATSKIKDLHSLTQLQTLGFRGEALASMAAVSRLTIISRVSEAASGWQLFVEGHDAVPKISPAAHPVGTTVDMRDLFFNTPARRKFLRTEKTELAQIQNRFDQIALSCFSTALTLKHKQKMICQLPEAMTSRDQLKRVGQICGEAFVTHCLEIKVEHDAFTLLGWIGTPAQMRSQADLQYFYLNGRFIRDKLVSHAIRQAYRDVQYGDRHPSYVLYLTVDPAWVDVNVHPTKQEVRFRESRQVHQFLFQAISQVLNHPVEAVTSSFSREVEKAGGEVPGEVSEKLTPPVAPETQVRQKMLLSELPQGTLPARKVYPKRHLEQHSIPFSLSEESVFYPQMGESTSEVASAVREEPPFAVEHRLGHAIGQVHGIYILAQNEEGLVLIDMHAAHERVLYERLKVLHGARKIEVQTLLVPLTCELTERGAACLLHQRDALMDLGLQIDQITPTHCVIRAYPVLFHKMDMVQLVQDMVSDWLVDEDPRRLERSLDELLGNLSCKSAQQAHTRLSIPEMDALLREMEKTPKSGYCCHGRPTYRIFPLKELDRFFLRGR